MTPTPSLPPIASPHVTTETASGLSPTKILCITFTSTSASASSGEWTIEWDDMYGDLLHTSSAASDTRSARSEQDGSYFALQRGASGSAASTPAAVEPVATNPAVQAVAEITVEESTPKVLQGGFAGNEEVDGVSMGANTEDVDIEAPLSTAKLLEFENGVHLQRSPSCADSTPLPTFFSSRPLVQAPAQIRPSSPNTAASPSEATAKFEVLFLLSPATPLPPSVRILYTPQWSSPEILAEVPSAEFTTSTPVGTKESLHETWARLRLVDLAALAEIAAELEAEGARGQGMGRVKVGVQGAGMDEEAVRRESFLVGEESAWVREHFLGSGATAGSDSLGIDNPHVQVHAPTAGLGITAGLQALSVDAALSSTDGQWELPLVQTEKDHDSEVEEDLFALPLSPRSPDMAVSPFSMFRDPAKGPNLGVIGVKPSGLRQVVTIDTASAPDARDADKDTTPTARTATAGGVAPPTPPEGA